LNRYPGLRGVFNNYISRGYYENIDVEYVPGAVPTAYFYNENQIETGSVPLGDMDINGFKKILADHGFELRRPKLPEPIFTSELTDGRVTYKYYGAGKLYLQDAEDFAQSQTHNGEKGRLLTIRCKEQEEKLDNWIKSLHGEAVIWLAGSDKEREGFWKWSNGDIFWTQLGIQEPGHYSNWKPGEPNHAGGNENCATYTPERGWNDVDCESSAQLVVEFGPMISRTCTQESVLQHVQSNLHDHEVNL